MVEVAESCSPEHRPVQLSVERLVAVVPRLAAALPATLSGIVGGDGSPPPVPEVAAAAADLLWNLRLHDAPFGELVPGAMARTGRSIPFESLPSVVANKVREHTDLSWDALLALRPDDVIMWRGTGELKARALLAFVIESGLLGEMRGDVSEVQAREGSGSASDALGVLGAWAAAHHPGVTLWQAVIAALDPENDAPADAVAVLATVPADVFSDDVHRLRFDPDVAADHLLEPFDERERAVLERKLAITSSTTLDQLGQRFGVTRQRMEQVDRRSIAKLAARLHLPEAKAFVDRARHLGAVVGRAVPLDRAPSELVPDDDSLRDELYAWVAGPYRLEEGWLVAHDVPKPLTAWVASLVHSLGGGEPVAVDALGDALLGERVDPEHHGALLEMSSRVRVLGEDVVPWGGAIGDKAAFVLRWRGVPMTLEAIVDAIGEGHTTGTLRNALGAPRFVRLTKTTYGLAEWGGEEYPGLAPAIIAAIEADGGSTDLEQLGRDLADRFGFSPKSAGLFAHTSPMVIVEGGSVRLRRDDEPYVPKGSLELTARCYVVDGAWALAMPVTHDVLRGSGTVIPEVFAVHLGLQPGDKGSMAAGDREILVAWGKQNPYIGSLRRVVEVLGGIDGDMLFVRRATPTALDFRLSQAEELTSESAPVALGAHLGIAPGAADDLVTAVGAALGLGGAVRPQVPALRGRFVERRESALAELLDAAVGADGSGAPARW